MIVIGTLLGIAFRSQEGGRMYETDGTLIDKARGIDRKENGNPDRRVTLLSQEKWGDACRELGVELSWTVRRANLYIAEIPLGPEMVGKRIRIGSEVVLQVALETKPCDVMDETCTGLKDALTPDWRGGVSCRVIEGGAVFVGDEVGIE